MGFIYYMKFPLIEQFKSNTEKWPWEENYEEFCKDFKRQLKAACFNKCFMTPIMIFGYYGSGIPLSIGSVVINSGKHKLLLNTEDIPP